ncbi:heparinase II/III family protein [Paenibacillus tarimensis]
MKGFPFVNGEEWAKRLAGGSNVTPLMNEIIQAAEQYVSEPLPNLTYSLFKLYETTGDRMHYQRVYFGRRGRLSALALACLATEEDRYTEALSDAIWSICDEYTWCLPAHLPGGGPIAPQHHVDLFAAETAHALAEIVKLLELRLPARVKQRVYGEIERRVFRPVFDSDYSFFWKTSTHNWAAVCAGAVGMAAMLLIEDQDRLDGMIRQLLPVMDCFLSGYGDDGGCAEGVGYWEYGFGFYVYFADMLFIRTNGNTDLLDNEKVRAISLFPEAVHLSDSVFANYSDAPERAHLHPGLLSRLSERLSRTTALPYRLPGFNDDPCYRWAHLSRNLAWTKVSCFQVHFDEGATWLRDLQWMMDKRMLSGFPVAFSAKGGHNDEPHNHNDLGHFIVHAGGQNLLCDLGYGEYTKDYFGQDRYRILNTSSGGHSVPVINGFVQAAGVSYEAAVEEKRTLEQGTVFRLDLTGAYPEEAGLTRFIRTFHWQNEPAAGLCRLTLRDEFEFREQSAIEERFVSLVRPEVTEGTAVWEAGRFRLTLKFDAAALAPVLEKVQYRDHGGEAVDAFLTKLSLTQREAACTHSFEFLLTLKD